jgi:FkbM family methyltransferase
MAELKTLLTGLGITHVLDVGAHRGGFYHRLRTDVGYNGTITSFEPSPMHYRELLAMASGDPKWSAMNVALGAKAGSAEFHQYSGGGHDGQCDSLRDLGPFAAEFDRDMSFERTTIDVTVQRLDSVWPQVGAVAGETFLKVDTQGFDLEVLAGAGDLITQFPALLLEVAVMPIYIDAPVVPDVFMEMARNRFELTGAFPVHRYADGLRVIEFDCTFVNQRVFEQ